MRFHFKIMSPEITAPLFVSPRCIPLWLDAFSRTLIAASFNIEMQISIHPGLLQRMMFYASEMQLAAFR